MSHIEVFDISYNKIETVEALIPVFRRCHNLKLLNVSYNKISSFGRIFPIALSHQNWTLRVDVSGNPLPQCSSGFEKETLGSNNLQVLNNYVQVGLINVLEVSWIFMFQGWECGDCSCRSDSSCHHLTVNCSSRDLPHIPNIQTEAARNIRLI